ncbi:MAG: Ornithine cyclodeaminase [Bryobacterales bacterium]|nr:Ornithine cyclodeaminase [Bryobacterales bacterium]
MLIIDEARVRELLSLEELIPAMERALIDFSAGRVTQPVRSILTIPEHGGFWGLMPAVYGDLMGVKLVMAYERNAQIGLPTRLATIQLFRASTGEPLALMDGRLITELRTAAVSAVATRLLSSPSARTIAILGSGVQARSHARAMRMVRDFGDVRVWSPTAENARRCAVEIGGRAMESAEAAVRGADVVVTATHAAAPVLRGEWLGEATYVNAIGGLPATRRELDDEVMRGVVVVESRAAAGMESGDIVQAGATIYAEIGELLAGTRAMPVRGRVVFKSVGIGVEDLAAAGIVYGKDTRR